MIKSVMFLYMKFNSNDHQLNNWRAGEVKSPSSDKDGSYPPIPLMGSGAGEKPRQGLQQTRQVFQC